MKIKTRIQITGLSVVVIVATLSIMGIYFFAALNIKSSLNDSMALLANSRAEQAEIYLDGLRGRILDFSIDNRISTCLANITGVINGTCAAEEVSNDLLINKLIAAKEFNEVYLIDINDNIVASSSESSVGLNITNDLVFIQGTQLTYVSNVYFSNDEKTETAITLAAPIKYSGKDIGLIAAEVDLTTFNNILLNSKGLGKTGDVYIIDKKGTILTPSRFDKNIALNTTINTENSRECFKDMETYLNDNGTVGDHLELSTSYITFSGDKVVGTHSYLEDQGWCLITESKQEEISATLKPILIFQIVVGCAIILIFFMASHFISKRITAPLNKLNQEVNHVADGYYKHKFRTKEFEEYDELSKSIDKLVEILYDFRHKDKKE